MVTGFSRPKIEEDVDLLGHKRGACAAVGYKQFVQRRPDGDAKHQVQRVRRLATDHALVQAYEPPPVAEAVAKGAAAYPARRATRRTFIEGELTAEKDPLSATRVRRRPERRRRNGGSGRRDWPAVGAVRHDRARAAVEALLQREKDYNESFGEVDRLVRAKRHEEVEANSDAGLQPDAERGSRANSAAATARAHGTARLAPVLLRAAALTRRRAFEREARSADPARMPTTKGGNPRAALD